MPFFRRIPAEPPCLPPAQPGADDALPQDETLEEAPPDEDELLDALPANVPLRCPICDSLLERDLHWRSSHWLCRHYHSWSNVRALIAELNETGKMPAGMFGSAPTPARAKEPVSAEPPPEASG